jgi:hypothetical protein
MVKNQIPVIGMGLLTQALLASIVITSREENMMNDTKTETRPYQDTRDIEEIRQEALLYQSLFDGKRACRWIGSLIDIVKATPPDARRYAAIATLYFSYFSLPDGRYITAPGGFFTSVCKRYRVPDVEIPAEVRAWSETGQSLLAIKGALEQGLRHPALALLPSFDVAFHIVEIGLD